MHLCSRCQLKVWVIEITVAGGAPGVVQVAKAPGARAGQQACEHVYLRGALYMINLLHGA